MIEMPKATGSAHASIVSHLIESAFPATAPRHFVAWHARRRGILTPFLDGNHGGAGRREPD
jgi:hypothetical protein